MNSIDCFKKILAVNPQQPVVVSALASAYEGIGDLKQSRECLKRYLHMENRGEMAAVAKDRMPVLKKVMKTAGDVDGSDYFDGVAKPLIARWSLTRMPLRVFIEPGDSTKNYEKSYENCIPRALDLWCKATDGKISWTSTDDKAHADIEVRYTADAASIAQSKSQSEAGLCKTHVGAERRENWWNRTRGGELVDHQSRWARVLC